MELSETQENVGQQLNRQNQIAQDAQRNQFRRQRYPRIIPQELTR